MGIGAREYLAGREVIWTGDAVRERAWVRPFQHSDEFVLFVRRNKVGEVYPAPTKLSGGHDFMVDTMPGSLIQLGKRCCT